MQRIQVGLAFVGKAAMRAAGVIARDANKGAAGVFSKGMLAFGDVRIIFVWGALNFFFWGVFLHNFPLFSLIFLTFLWFSLFFWALESANSLN